MELTIRNNKTCRLCFDSTKNIINIFDTNGIKLNIAKIISTHFWFEVTENDGLSNVICTQCWWYIENFHNFYNNIEIAYNNCINIANTQLNKNFNDNNKKIDLPVNIENDKSNNYINKLIDITFIKLEDVNKDFQFNDNENIDKACINELENTKTNSTIEKLKPYDIHSKHLDNDMLHHTSSANDCNDNDNCSDYIDTENSTTNDNKIVRKLRKRKIQISKDIIVPKRKNIKKTKEPLNNDKKKTISTDNDLTCEKNKPIYLNRKSKETKIIINVKERKLAIAKEDAQIREYFKMECDLCGFKFQTYLEAKMHYRTEHEVNGYLTCCGRKFERRGRILEHILRHLNPEVYKCEFCNKIYADKTTLKYHIESHAFVSDKPYKCNTCPRSFMKSFLLSQHTKLRHANKQFTCDECGKSFPSKPNLVTHINFVHLFTYAQICDICAKVFKSKQVLKNHRQAHFLTDVKPKLQCNICGAWLKHEQSLRTHMTLHKDKTQKCPKCDKETPNRQSLRNHMRYVHADRTHICLLCDKAFKQPIGLKEHMASHTGEDLYTCPYCPKTFKSGANMHSHRKKIHPIEWQKDREKRNI